MRRNLVLVALMLTMMLAAMDNTIVATAIPQIVEDLGGFSLFTWLFSIYLLIQTVTIPIYGKLSDIFGRKPVLIVGVGIFLVGSLACGVSWNMLSLIVFRGMQAVGAGSIMASVNTIAGDIYTIEERAKIQGWLSSVWGVSAIVGPALGGFFAEYASWRWIFLINIPIGLFALLLLTLYFKEEKPQSSQKVDIWGALTILAAGSVLMFGFLQGGQGWPWLSIQSFVLFSLGFVLLYITFRKEQIVEEPIFPLQVWKRPAILGANLATIGLGITSMASNMYLPLFSQSVLGVSAMLGGFILASMSITWPTFSAISGFLYLRMGFRNTAMVGAILVLFAACLFVLIPYPGTIGWLVLMQLVFGAGFGLMATPLMVGVQSTVNWNERGMVTGANMFSRYIGQSIGSVLFAAIFNHTLNGKIVKSSSLSIKSIQPDTIVDTILSNKVDKGVQHFLRLSFFDATQAVYWGVGVISLITLVILIYTPAIFPLPENEGLGN